jgi:hypothetical protein
MTIKIGSNISSSPHMYSSNTLCTCLKNHYIRTIKTNKTQTFISDSLKTRSIFTLQESVSQHQQKSQRPMRAEIAAESSGAGPKRRQHWRSTDERCADREINWESKKRAGSSEHSRQRLDEATRDDTERADRQMKSGGEKSRALGDSWAGGKTKIDLRCPKA